MKMSQTQIEKSSMCSAKKITVIPKMLSWLVTVMTTIFKRNGNQLLLKEIGNSWKKLVRNEKYGKILEGDNSWEKNVTDASLVRRNSVT